MQKLGQPDALPRTDVTPCPQFAPGRKLMGRVRCRPHDGERPATDVGQGPEDLHILGDAHFPVARHIAPWEDQVPQINSNFNMASVRMMGGAAREQARKKWRGVLSTKFANHTLDTADVPLEMVFEGDGFGADCPGMSGAVPAGKYAYVTMLDGSVRIWPTKGVDNKDTDHPALCSFSQRVLYAGELWINEKNMITEWNNGSGAFHPSQALNAQAGLPLTKFKAHVPTH